MNEYELEVGCGCGYEDSFHTQHSGDHFPVVLEAELSSHLKDELLDKLPENHTDQTVGSDTVEVLIEVKVVGEALLLKA